MKNNGLVFNVFIAIMQSIISTYRSPHVSPREGVGRVVSNNTINNIYIYIFTIRIRGLGWVNYCSLGHCNYSALNAINFIWNTCNV